MPPLRALATLALTAVLAACGARSADSPLVVGTEAAFPPFESIAASGDVEGFDIDLMRLVGGTLGREVTFRNMEFSALIPDLQSGRIDAIASGLSYTDERAKVIRFSRPYCKVPTGILVSTAKVDANAAHTTLDAADVVIAVQRKTTGEEKAKAAFPQAQIKSYDREVDAAAEVAAGRAHALVYDMVSIVKLHAQHAETTAILDVELGTELYCIAWPQSMSADLAERVDAFLHVESRPGGKVDLALEKWLGDSARFRVEDE